MARRIYFLKINYVIGKLNSIHSASDIDTDNIRAGLVYHSHGGSDCAALSCMNIRHDSDPAVLSKCIAAHSANLLYGFVFYNFSIADRRCYSSFYLQHIFLPFKRGRSIMTCQIFCYATIFA